MSLLPPGMKERIIWYEAHIAQFAANAVAIALPIPRFPPVTIATLPSSKRS